VGAGDPDQETIDRRSDNAEATLGCLGKALGCAWIVSGAAFLAPFMFLMERI
tara:strand:+ start:20838 stop:20993 length:156 start_codon:yes stop_codon:yes gene_type:complete